MKPTSIQQPEDNRKDVMRSIYIDEFRTRGIEYFETISRFPQLFEGVTAELPFSILNRLYFAPNLKTILSSSDWRDELSELLESGWTIQQFELISEMIEDISFSVKVREPELYTSCLALLKQHLSDAHKEAWDVLGEENVMGLYYLRRVSFVFTPRALAKEANQYEQ